MITAHNVQSTRARIVSRQWMRSAGKKLQYTQRVSWCGFARSPPMELLGLPKLTVLQLSGDSPYIPLE